MNNKYVIKNCPAYNPKHCDCLNTKEIACLYRTNCVMKQIVEECKDKIRIYEYYDKDYALGQVECAKAILQLLNIQENNQ